MPIRVHRVTGCVHSGGASPNSNGANSGGFSTNGGANSTGARERCMHGGILAQVQLCMTQNTLHGGANTEGANGGGTNRYASCGCVSFNAIDKHNSKRQSATSFENTCMENAQLVGS